MSAIDPSQLRRYLDDAEYRRSLLRAADRLLEGPAPHEAQLSDAFATKFASCLARSRQSIASIQAPLRVGVVFAMWREARRLLPRSAGNPTGEDCLAFKLETLDWLFSGTPIRYHLYAVDDDCPEDSRGVAERLCRERGFGDRVTLLHIRDGFPYADEPLARLPSVESSTKGGAIALGASRAIADGCDFVAYTDCDVSVHLGQLGNLLEPAARRGKLAVFGDRTLNRDFTFWDDNRGTEAAGAKLLSHVRRLLLTLRLPLFDVPSPARSR